MTLTDVVASRTLGNGAGAIGRAVGAQQGGRLAAERLVIADAAEVGLYVGDAGSSLEATDVSVRRAGVRGVVLQGGGTAAITRLAVEQATEVGIAVFDEGTRATLADVLVEGILGLDGAFGGGAAVQLGATLELDRALVRGARDLGVTASTARLALRDVVVRGTESQESDGLSGDGLLAQLAAEVTLERVALEDNRDVGLLAISEGTTVAATDLVIRSTRDGACHRVTCRAGGTGLSVLERAAVDVERFWIDDHPLVGIQVALDGSIAARHGLVSSAVVGVNVAVPGLDIEASFVDVRTHGNVRDLDALELPLPHVPPPLGR